MYKTADNIAINENSMTTSDKPWKKSPIDSNIKTNPVTDRPRPISPFVFEVSINLLLNSNANPNNIDSILRVSSYCLFF